jgi:hypothetical protein
MSELPNSRPSLLSQLLQVPVIVAALGYLVDMYDLFSIQRGAGSQPESAECPY